MTFWWIVLECYITLLSGEGTELVGSRDKWEEAEAVLGRGREQKELQFGMADVKGGEHGCEMG